MVLLSLLMGLAAAAPTPAEDDLLELALLPIRGGHPQAAALDRALAAGVPQGAKLRPISAEAREALLLQPRCRAQPRCLSAWLGDATLSIDVEVRPENKANKVNLIVRGADAQVERRSFYVGDAELYTALSAELQRVVSPLMPDVALFARATAGDANAAAQLRARFPESPWTRALPAQDEPARP